MSPAPARVDELKKRYEENPRRFFAPLANEYRKAGDLDAAIDLCRMHLEEQPGHLSGHIVYGQALYEAGRAGDAKTTFEAALELDPENLIALRHLGDIAQADKDATAARHWYQRVLDADPRNEEVLGLIASLETEARTSTVTIAVETEAPPPPQYAITDAAPAEAPAADPTGGLPLMDLSEPVAPLQAAESVQAPAGIEQFQPPVIEMPEPDTISMISEPPAAPPMPRESIGLMDLDLSLGSDESATFEAGFPVADTIIPPPADLETATTFESPELLGADDTNLGLGGDALDISAVPSELPVVEDTSFGAAIDEPPTAPTFLDAPTESAFGDSLDVTAGAMFDTADMAPAPAPSAPADAAFTLEPFTDPSTPEPDATLDDVAAELPSPETDAAIVELGLPVADAVEPAAPTAADFDMLFGSATSGDVTVGADGTHGIPDEQGFVDDPFIGREMVAPAADPGPVVTETMAEIYLGQGLKDRALEVYRQLASMQPADARLAAKVADLEAELQPAPADTVNAEIAAAAAEVATFAATVPMAPAAAEEPPVFEPAATPAPVATIVTPTFAPIPPSSGPSVRELFARIAARRAVPSVAAAAEPVMAAVVETPSYTEAPMVASAATVAPGSIDAIFGHSGVNTFDEGAAATVSSAFSGTATEVRGEPTRPGQDEISLDSVFGGGQRQSGAPQVTRQSTKLRFDQFFAGAGNDGEAPSAPAPSAPAAGGDDNAQFSDWLKGLKNS